MITSDLTVGKNRGLLLFMNRPISQLRYVCFASRKNCGLLGKI